MPPRAPAAQFLFPRDPEELVDDAATRGSAQGTDSFCEVRLTGAGADAGVKFVSRPDAKKMGPPPAPTADVFGAVMGT